MSLIKTSAEIKILREGGKILAEILAHLSSEVQEGISTLELDRLAREEIAKHQVQPAFEGYQISPSMPAYPGVLCTSINDEIVHGIPSPERILKAGQIIGLDFGIIHQGLYTDAAVTVGVGKISTEAQGLLDHTRQALRDGIAEVRPGNTIGDIASAIQDVARKNKYGVVRDLIGHGVGHKLHEKPDVPNYGKPGTLEKLLPGMVIAIEPMFTLGDYRIKVEDDFWTITTADQSLAAHFEHSVAVTESGYLVLTEI